MPNKGMFAFARQHYYENRFPKAEMARGQQIRLGYGGHSTKKPCSLEVMGTMVGYIGALRTVSILDFFSCVNPQSKSPLKRLYFSTRTGLISGRSKPIS